jgi:hypothetical protein
LWSRLDRFARQVRAVVEVVFFAAGAMTFIVGFGTLVLAWRDYGDRDHQWKVEEQLEMTRSGPGGQSFIAKHCISAARNLIEDKDGAGPELNKLGQLHDARQSIEIKGSEELKNVESCLADHDSEADRPDAQREKDSAWHGYVYEPQTQPDRRRLTVEGSAELMRRINVEANFDEQIATLTNNHLADPKLMIARFNARMCGTGQNDGDGLYYLELEQQLCGPDGRRVFSDYDGTIQEVLKYIGDNCPLKFELKRAMSEEDVQKQLRAFGHVR